MPSNHLTHCCPVFLPSIFRTALDTTYSPTSPTLPSPPWLWLHCRKVGAGKVSEVLLHFGYPNVACYIWLIFENRNHQTKKRGSYYLLCKGILNTKMSIKHLFICSVMSDSSRLPGLHTVCQAPLSSTISWSFLKFVSMTLSNHHIPSLFAFNLF